MLPSVALPRHHILPKCLIISARQGHTDQTAPGLTPGAPRKRSLKCELKVILKLQFLTMVNSVDSAILCQINVTKKWIYHTGNNYHFHSNVNYIYYQN